MEGVKTSRFPLIREGFHVGGVTAERESPERSWARIRTYLIDNPKDEGLIRRQEIWSYQNRNRGVIKSMLKSVPNVPYRVKKRKMDKLAERSRQDSNSLVLPKLQKIDDSSQGRVKIRGVFSPPPKPRPLGYTKDFDTKRKEIREQISKFESAAKFLGKPTPVDDFSNAKQYDAAKSTLKTISEKFPYIPEQKQLRNISHVDNHGNHGALSPQKRNMSFSLNDLRSDDRQVLSRCSYSSSSMSSAYSDSVIGNYDGHYGPSSHNYIEASKFSVYDILNKNAVGDARTLGVQNDYQKSKELHLKEKKNNGGAGKPQWFEKVLEDKEIFNMSEYDNYARIKPRQDIPRNNNNNVNMKSKTQNFQSGRNNNDYQGKSSYTTAIKAMTDKQTQNLSSRSNGNSQKNPQHTVTNRLIPETDNVQTTKSTQDKSVSKQSGNGPKPSIYSQNQSKSVYPHNSAKPRNTGNTFNPEQMQTETPTRFMESRTLSNRNQMSEKDASLSNSSSRLSPEKSVNLTGRVSSENRNNQSSRLFFSKESSPNGRLSVEKKNTPVTSPIQKPYVKPLQNTGNKSVINNLKTPVGGNQRLPFDVPRTMPRVPMKTSGYFPIFSSDGRPVGKIGKPKNNLNNIPKVQTSPVRDYIENQENFQSQLPVLNTMSEASQLNAPVFI